MSAAAVARPVDARALARQRRRLCRREQAPWLHAEVARRMAERLAIIRAKPDVVLDWWAPLGASGEVLRAACAAAKVVDVWPDEAAPHRAPSAPIWRRWIGRAAQPATAIAEHDVPAASAAMLWSNMGLHWSEDPPALFGRWRRALATDGFVLFSTFGPGTLAPLRALYAESGWGPPMAPLVDMHDLGDMLVAAGFAGPVMDQETLTLHWADAASLLRELRELGGNGDAARHTGWRTPRWQQRLELALNERRDAAGRIAMPFEIVYGHAIGPAPSASLRAETRIDAEDLRAMARARRRT